MQQAGRQAGILKDDADKDDDNEAWEEDEDEDEAEQWVDISKLPVKCVLSQQQQGLQQGLQQQQQS